MKWNKKIKEQLRALVKEKLDQILSDLRNRDGDTCGWAFSPEINGFLDAFEIKMVDWDCKWKTITLADNHRPDRYIIWEEGDPIPHYKRRKNTIVIPGPYDSNRCRRWDWGLEIPKEIAEKFLVLGVP
jgi:hypothetical protein